MVYFSGFISFYFLTRALDIYVDFKNLISIRSLSLIITSIPISIGGFGLREGSFLILFESFGIDSTRIISLSFLLFSRTLFLGIIGGILEFVNIITPDDNKI